MTVSTANAIGAPPALPTDSQTSYNRHGDHTAMRVAGDGNNVTLAITGSGQVISAVAVAEPLTAVPLDAAITKFTFGVSYDQEVSGSLGGKLLFAVYDLYSGVTRLDQLIETPSTGGLVTATYDLGDSTHTIGQGAAIALGLLTFQMGFDTSLGSPASLVIDHMWVDVTWEPATPTSTPPLRLRQNGGGVFPPLRLRQDGAR